MSIAANAPQKTALADLHPQSGAKMVDFAGWEMPIEYSGIRKEHDAVRAQAGLFDLSHMGEVVVRGPGAMEYVQGLVTNDLSKLAVGKAQYNCMCNEQGKVLDDMVIYRFPDHLYVVMNASNRAKIVEWMVRHQLANVTVEDQSMQTSLVAIQGPMAQALLQPLASVDLEKIAYYGFAEGSVAGVPAIISRTGYTGEDGFELYVPWTAGRTVWNALLEKGALPIGLGARDTLRLESGYSLYGHELDESVTPLDAGLGWITKLDHEFIGREALQLQKETGLTRTIVGLSMVGRSIPREGYPVFQGERRVGTVTSGTFSPSLKRGIALATVETAVRADGTELEVEIRERREKAVVTRPPFVKGSVRRA
jgi:aminomethyltransferase